jgi:hypothetical protein
MTIRAMTIRAMTVHPCLEAELDIDMSGELFALMLDPSKLSSFGVDCPGDDGPLVTLFVHELDRAVQHFVRRPPRRRNTLSVRGRSCWLA